MKRYSKNSKPFIYVAFPQNRRDEIFEVLEVLNKDKTEFWYPDSFDNSEIRRINASYNVLLFVDNAYAKSDEFRNVVDNAVNANKNILCVYLEKIEETPWLKMQLSSQQSLRTDSIDDGFIERIRTSFIFKDMKVTDVQKKQQRNKAFVLIAVPIVAIIAIFFIVINPLLAAEQTKEDLINNWGLKENDLEQIYEIYLIGDRKFYSPVHAEYEPGKNQVHFWYDAKHDGKLVDGGLWPTGTLTSKDLEIVKYMPNLRRLYILGEQITDLSPLFGSHITTLNLSCNPISSLEGIEQIPELRTLILTDTDISDIEPVRGLKYLELLQINNTNVENIDAVEDLTNLNWLNICDTKVTKITKMPKLSSSIQFSLQATGDRLTDVCGLSNIPCYREVSLDNYSNSSLLDKNLGEALSNSTVTRFYYNGCSSYKDISTFKMKNGQISMHSVNANNFDGIENVEGLCFLEIYDMPNNETTDLTALLESKTLKSVQLPSYMRELANRQLKETNFSISYE